MTDAPTAGRWVEAWDDVPAVSEDFGRARAAIDARIVRLLEALPGAGPVGIGPAAVDPGS